MDKRETHFAFRVKFLKVISQLEQEDAESWLCALEQVRDCTELPNVLSVEDPLAALGKVNQANGRRFKAGHPALDNPYSNHQI